MRVLTDQEKMLIAGVADKLNQPERGQLLQDLESATVASVASNGSRVVFEIDGYKRPPYRGQHLFSVEGKMLDGDGSELSVLLHADENGRLLELEFIRWDSHELLCPRWDTLRLQ